jgi:hypothetical protein
VGRDHERITDVQWRSRAIVGQSARESIAPADRREEHQPGDRSDRQVVRAAWPAMNMIATTAITSPIAVPPRQTTSPFGFSTKFYTLSDRRSF